MTQNQPTQMVNYAEIGEAISHELAAKMVKDFHDTHSANIPRNFTVGKNIILQLLSQPGCVAMRIYNAIDETGKQTLVHAAVDEKGRTIVEYPIVDKDGSLGMVKALLLDRIGNTTSSGWAD